MKRLGIGVTGILVTLLASSTVVHAASCNGASHEMSLSSGSASPAAGTTSTVVTFSVRYVDNAGCAPTAINVSIPGVGTILMSSNQTAFANGVVFARALTLPPGTHTYSFTASSGTGRGQQSSALTSVSPASVIIRAPAPPPTPAPTASPAPTAPPPTPRPTIAPTAAPTTAPAPAAPTGPPTAIVPPPPTAVATPPTQGTPAPDPSSPAPSAAAASPDVAPATPPAVSSPSPTESSSAGGGVVRVGGVGGLTGSSFDPISGPAAFGLAALAAAAGGVLWLVAARRRRGDGSPSVSASAAGMAAAAPETAAMAAADDYRVTPLPAMRELIPPIDRDLLREDGANGEPRPDEAAIPRWLRTSVREARFAGDRDRRRDWH
ncbi:MAG: hypothetical protein ACR2K4_06175 [Candidatus Limnocylindria bacterium]